MRLVPDESSIAVRWSHASGLAFAFRIRTDPVVFPVRGTRIEGRCSHRRNEETKTRRNVCDRAHPEVASCPSKRPAELGIMRRRGR